MGLMGARLGQYPTAAIWDLARQSGARSGVDPALVMAVMQVESHFNPRAVNPSDPSYGLMQMLPATASLLAGRSVSGQELLDNPALAVDLGTQYLAQGLARYGNTGDAIAAYNAGTARRNAQGQYVNSRGDTAVDTYVNNVLDAYLTLSGSTVPAAAGTLPPVDVGLDVMAPADATQNWLAWGALAALGLVGIVLVTD
jgi:soluble lytic murein transglycosylase-like protein